MIVSTTSVVICPIHHCTPNIQLSAWLISVFNNYWKKMKHSILQLWKFLELWSLFKCVNPVCPKWIYAQTSQLSHTYSSHLEYILGNTILNQEKTIQYKLAFGLGLDGDCAGHSLLPFPKSILHLPLSWLYRLHHLGFIDLWFLVGLGQCEAIKEIKGQEERFRVFLPLSVCFALQFCQWLHPSMTIAPPHWTSVDTFSSSRLQWYVPSLLLSVLRVLMTSPGAILGIFNFACKFP